MKFLCRILLCALAAAPLLPAADQLKGFPFQSESLQYRVLWPGGRLLGDVRMSARKAACPSDVSGPANQLVSCDAWDFELSTNVNIPLVPIADKYSASAAGFDFCSVSLTRDISHGNKRVSEKTQFDQKKNIATRQTMVPAGGGKTELQLPTCGRDALTYIYYARREMGQGRVPPAGKVFFGSAYEVKTRYTGPMDIPVGGKNVTTDKVDVSVKGPASEFSLEIYYDRDAARTPLLIKIPVPIGTVSLELVR